VKEISKTEKREWKMYKCEICGAEYQTPYYAERCEKRHSCKHEKAHYEFIESSDDAWWFQVRGIKKTCVDCGKFLGEKDLEDIEDNQEVLIKIYDLICLAQ